jgi:hypothetical protein
VNETDHYAHELRNSTGKCLSQVDESNEVQSVAAEEIYTKWTIFMFMGTVQNIF